MTILRISTPLCLATLFFVTSCKKKDTISASTNRLIVSVVDSEIATTPATGLQQKTVFTWWFNYNADGTVSTSMLKRQSDYPKPSLDTVFMDFAYFQGFYVRTSDKLYLKDTVRVDTAGNILRSSAYWYYYQPSTNKVEAVNSVGREYFWDDNNIKFYTTSPSDTIYYEYYTDKAVRPGDGIQLPHFTSYGRPIFRTKNLIKSTTSTFAYSPSKTTYAYIFDSQDRITTMISTFTSDSRTVKTYYKFTY